MNLQEFLNRLEATKGKWHFGPQGIRCETGRCPVINVAYEGKFSLIENNVSYPIVAQLMNLDETLADDIAIAADWRPRPGCNCMDCRPRVSDIVYNKVHTRALIEDATGLGMEPWLSSQ